MAKPVFGWKADLGASRNMKPNINQTKFGDGYELRVATGINFMPRVWDVVFTRDPAEAMSILSFLEERGGLESFQWTDPLGKNGVFVCREWTATQKMLGIYEVSGSFEEVFES